MEIIYHFYSPDCVLLLNGSFVQSASSVRYNDGEPLYITVLPLSAEYIMYTVKFLSGKAVTNASLTRCCDMGGGHCYAELRKHSAYVYPPALSRVTAAQNDAPNTLLSFIKQGNITAARSLLTPELNQSISDSGLTEFFGGVEAMRENVYTDRKGYLLVKTDGTAPVCRVTYRGGLIDDISVDD